MKGWNCSLLVASEEELLLVAQVWKAMEAADVLLFEALESVDWHFEFQDANTLFAGYFRLVEHEAHHHGQLINFSYACNFPIPQSWADSWALTRQEK